MSTSIKARCDADGEVELAPCQITLIVYDNDPKHVSYEFECPSCHLGYLRPLPDMEMQEALIRAGVNVRVIESYPEKFDTSAPPLSRDDELDFHQFLESWDGELT